MRYEGEIRVLWSWTELTAVREAIELTPLFAGREELRVHLRRRPRAGHMRAVKLDLVLAEHLAANLVSFDMQTAIAKAKLLRALQDTGRGPDLPDAVQAA